MAQRSKSKSIQERWDSPQNAVTYTPPPKAKECLSASEKSSSLFNYSSGGG